MRMAVLERCRTGLDRLAFHGRIGWFRRGPPPSRPGRRSRAESRQVTHSSADSAEAPSRGPARNRPISRGCAGCASTQREIEETAGHRSCGAGTVGQVPDYCPGVPTAAVSVRPARFAEEAARAAGDGVPLPEDLDDSRRSLTA